MDDEARKDVLGEQLLSELQAIREYVEDIPEMKADIAELKQDVAEIKRDNHSMRTAVRQHSLDIVELKRG